MPEPARAMTTPWKTCTRSFWPSMTRTCTFSVSPGAKAGMSLRRLVWSTRSVGFMARRSNGGPGLSAREGGRERLSLVELGQQSDVLRGEPAACGHQVGASCDRAAEGLGTAPAGHPAVVATAQDVGHRPAPE